MADIAIFRINYKSDFILTLQSDAGWMTPFCIKFWTGAPSQAYFAGYDGTTYTHCAPVEGDPTKLSVQFDDHHLPVGDLKFQIGYHFTVADFPTSVEDEVINQSAVIIDNDGERQQVMLDLNGETAPEIAFSLPAYANEAQRIANEQQRIANEQTRIANEEARIAAETIRQQNEEQRIEHETARVDEFAQLKRDSEQATSDANTAANLANEKAQLAADKAALAQAAATLAGDKAQLADDKAALAQAAAILANEKAALAQQKAEYAQTQGNYANTQGDYAKNQGDYAKEQGDTAQADHVRAEADHAAAADDHQTAAADHTTATDDHSTAVSDHSTAESDHSRAEADHTTAAADHETAESDHSRAETDHITADADHETASSDHTRAESDHAAVEVYVDSLGAFDLSKYNAVGGVLATYTDLSAALTALNALDSKYKYGGMSFKFVQSSDNKYVQARFMLSSSFTDAQFTNVANWQGVDSEPTAGSKNLVESGGVKEQINALDSYVSGTGRYFYFEGEGVTINIPLENINHTRGDTITIYYDGDLSSLIVSCGTATSTSAILPVTLIDEHSGYFTVGSGATITHVAFTNVPVGTTIILVGGETSGSVLKSDGAQAFNASQKAQLLSNLGFADGTIDNCPVAGSKKAVNSSTVAYGDSFIESHLYTNLYNKNDVNCIEESYIVPSTGQITSGVSALKVSGYIPVKPGKSYCATNTVVLHGYRFLDSSLNVLSYGGLGAAMTAPENACYLQVSLYYNTESTNIVNEGNSLATYIPYGKIGISHIDTDSIGALTIAICKDLIDANVVIPQDCSFFTTSTNLYNKDASDCVDNKYVNASNGELSDLSNIKASGYIPVIPGKYYISNYGGQGAFYDKDKLFIPNSGISNASVAFVAPNNAAYVRVSYRMDSESENRLNQSQTLLPYKTYFQKIGSDFLDFDGVRLSESNLTMFEHSSNLYNRDSEGCLSGKYMAQSAGSLVYSNAGNLKVSDYIRVNAGDVLYGDKTYNYAYFDEEKNYKIDSCTMWINAADSITVPSGVYYIRVTFYISNGEDATNRLTKNSLRPFVEAGYNFKIPYYSLPYGRQMESKLGNLAAYQEASELLSNSSIKLEDFPKSLVKGNRISFEANVTSFTNLRIGKYVSWTGGGLWDSCYCEINQTNIVIKRYTASEQTVYTVAHGMTIEEFIKVVIKQENDNLLIVLQTLGGTFTNRPGMYLAFNGTPTVESLSSSFTNCKLTAENTDMKSSLWAFGDSYYGFNSDVREMYYLNQWGFANFLIQAYAGQTSTAAYADLLRLLNFGCPKYLIWSLGMNDDNSSVLDNIEDSTWYSYYSNIKKICEDRNIELILTTIPTPKDGGYKNKSLINTFIKSSGHRYVDAERAVGADTNGDWYNAGLSNDYQSDDNVHPSEYGAKALASQFLIDVPEIMQY